MKKLCVLLAIILVLVSCSPKEDNVTPRDDNYVDGEVVFQEETVTEDVYEDTKGVYMSLDQDKAYELMQNEEVIIVDVRTVEEYGQGYIKGANLLPVDMVPTEALNKFPDKNAVYLVYCRSGNRSKVAVNAMVELGYTEVYDIGGINTWPYEIVND